MTESEATVQPSLKPNRNPDNIIQPNSPSPLNAVSLTSYFSTIRLGTSPGVHPQEKRDPRKEVLSVSAVVGALVESPVGMQPVEDIGVERLRGDIQ